MIAEIRQLRDCLAPVEQREVTVLVVLSVLAGGSEFFTIGALVPLIAGLIASPPGSFDLFGGTLSGLAIGDRSMVVLAAVVAGFAMVSAGLRFTLVWRSERFCARMGSDLVQGIYARVMREDIAAFDARNSSEVLAAIDKVQGVEHGFVRPLLAAVTSAIIGVCLFALLLIIAPLIAASISVLVALAYLAISRLAVPHIRRYAIEMSQGWDKRTRLLRESLGAKREIMLARSFDQFETGVMAADIQFRKAQASNQTFAQTPRTLFQSGVVIVLVGAGGAIILWGGDVTAILPVFAGAAIALQRLLPLAQTVWNGTVQASGNRELVRDVIKLRLSPLARVSLAPNKAFGFTNQIECKRVTFAYDDGPHILDDLSFRIRRGGSVGISGPSGCGKSTLLDLLMGFRLPSSGSITVDGEELDGERLLGWQRGIGFVREASFLLDGTIRDNIVFGHGSGERCSDHLTKVVSIAQLDALIATLDKGLDAPIGEGGVKLSAGQRQRIAIARALYRRPDVLILDEGTNAIDITTEAAILDAIAREMPDLTLVMVTHRLQSLSHCAQRFEFACGRVKLLDTQGP